MVLTLSTSVLAEELVLGRALLLLNLVSSGEAHVDTLINHTRRVTTTAKCRQ